MMQRLLIRVYVFQQDSAPSHRACETVDPMIRETPNFTPTKLWPPNNGLQSSPEKVYKGRIKDIDELRFTSPDSLGRTRSGSGACVFVRVLKRKADILNTSCASSLEYGCCCLKQ